MSSQIVAKILYERNQIVRLELSQEALLELAGGKTLEFMGVRVTAIDTDPPQVRRVEWPAPPEKQR